MGPDTVMELGRQTLTTVALVCGPVLVIGMLAGLAISIFQAATQISEQTLSFLPKAGAVLAVMLLGGSWILEQLTTFTTNVIQQISEVGP